MSFRKIFIFHDKGCRKLQEMLAVLCPFMTKQRLAEVHNLLIKRGGVGDARGGQEARAWAWV